MSLSIEMTLRGVLTAGKWKTEDELKTYSDDACRNALIDALNDHSNQDVNYYRGFKNDDLIASGAIVVFFSQSQGVSRDRLKTMSDDDQRNTIIDHNNI